MNTAQLIADLKNMIGPGIEVDDTGLKRWVNDAYMTIVDEITKVRPEYFTKSSTTSTIENQQEYDLPDDWEKVLLANIQYDGVWARAKPMGDADIHFIDTHSDQASHSQSYTVSTPAYYIIGDNIGFSPIPTATVQGAIKVWYVYTPIELSEDDSVPAIPAKYHHIIKYGAYANYLDQDDEHVAAERMRMRFDEKVRQMTESIAGQQIDEEKSVIITTNQDMYDTDTTV